MMLLPKSKERALFTWSCGVQQSHALNNVRLDTVPGRYQHVPFSGMNTDLPFLAGNAASCQAPGQLMFTIGWSCKNTASVNTELSFVVGEGARHLE